MYRQISQGADSMEIAITLNNLANNCRHMEQYNKAEKYYLRALSRYRKISQGSYSVEELQHCVIAVTITPQQETGEEPERYSVKLWIFTSD